MRFLFVFTLLGAPAVLAAQSLDGWCLPANECTGMPMPIENGIYATCEARCSLSNPQAVRDMPAMLYDQECDSDWQETPDHHRALVLLQDAYPEPHLVMVTQARSITLERCR